MNPDIDRLADYPFTRLEALLSCVTPPPDRPVIRLSVGEPRHAPPDLVVQALTGAMDSLNTYPRTAGTDRFRQAAANWLTRRYRLGEGVVDAATMVLPLSGTREGLYSVAQAIVDRGDEPVVVVPNPLYQIYEGAAVMAGAQPYYLSVPAEDPLSALEAMPHHILRRCQLFYACSPGNPTGRVLDRRYLERLIALAHQHDFIIAADECYADIYPGDEQPPGLLETSAAMGRPDMGRCLVFHSLSKRSSVPGLRSGFVAGDARVMAQLTRFRTYHGCTMPLPVQAASVAAWNDDAHAADNRRRYDAKFAAFVDIVAPVLPMRRPAGAFYLWPRTPVDDERFARDLYRQQGVVVLPGSYVGRAVAGRNPGRNRVRISLVAEPDECVEAGRRIAAFVSSL